VTCDVRLLRQVNAARDERIKEIETKSQLEMEAKDAEVLGLVARLKKVTLFEEQQRKLEEERCEALLEPNSCCKCIQGAVEAGGVRSEPGAQGEASVIVTCDV
jgi:hypothetical protein